MRTKHGDPNSEHHSEVDTSSDAAHDDDAHQSGSGEDNHAFASHAGDAEGGRWVFLCRCPT